MNNFLYCFDENYNIPAFCSMFSILENANVEINIFVIHKLDKENISVPDKINNHKKLVKYIDVLGKESKPKKNTPLFYIYEDGSVEKKITIE